MGKWKDSVREHDEAIIELVATISKALVLVREHRVSVAEFVGNLECAKYMALTESDGGPGVRVLHVGDGDVPDGLGELIASILGRDDEEGGDE